eukprot:COSAG01_NODE_569_length_15354_cov_17.667584_6_plen_1093_part_00
MSLTSCWLCLCAAADIRHANSTYSTFELAGQIALHVLPSQAGDEQEFEGGRLWGAVGIYMRNLSTAVTSRQSDDGASIARSEILMSTAVSINIAVADDGNFWEGTSSYSWDVEVATITVQVAFSSLQLALFFSKQYGAALRADTGPPVLLIDQSRNRDAVRLSKRSIRLTCPLLQAQLVDDSQHSWVPLMRFSIVDIVVKMGIKDFGEEEFTTSGMSATISADSMNSALMEWEPIVEPSPITVDAEIYTYALKDTISVAAPAGLFVNVTRKMLVSMQVAAANWKDLATRPLLPIASFESSYEFVNETTMDLVVWLPSLSSEGVAQGKPRAEFVQHNLEPHGYVPFNLAQRSSGIGVRGWKIKHNKVRIDVEGYQSTIVDIDRVGALAYRLAPQLGSNPLPPPLWLMCNVSMAGRTKMASLCATVFVTNDSQQPVQISSEEPRDGDSRRDSREMFEIVDRGNGMPIDAGTEVLWLRPSAAYDWATVTLPKIASTKAGNVRNRVDKPVQLEVICNAHDAAEGIVSFCVTATVTKGTIALRITSTLAVHNRLPYALRFKLYRFADPDRNMKLKMLRPSTDSLMSEGMLTPGCQSFQSCSSVEDHVLMTVALDGFAWSDTCVISSPLHPRSKQVELNDDRECALQLNLDHRITSDQGVFRSVAVFCNCWIVNLTGLPLQYSRGGQTCAAGQPPGGNASARPVLVSWSKMEFKVANTALSTQHTHWNQDELPRTRSSGSSDRLSVGNSSNEVDFVETHWSKQFSTTAIRTSGTVTVTELGSGSERVDDPAATEAEARSRASKKRAAVFKRYDVCVTIKLGSGKYRRTKVVRLEPQWMLHNRIMAPLVYQQAHTDATSKLAPRSSCPIWWSDKAMPKRMCFKLDESAEQEWSAPVKPHSANNTVLVVGGKGAHRQSSRRLSFTAADMVAVDGSSSPSTPRSKKFPVSSPTPRRRRSVSQHSDRSSAPAEQLVRVDAQERGTTGAISVVVREYNPATPGYLVENHTAFTLSIWQKNVDNPRRIILAPHQAKPFVWQLPLEPHRVVAQLMPLDSAGDETLLDHAAAAAAAAAEAAAAATGIKNSSVSFHRISLPISLLQF